MQPHAQRIETGTGGPIARLMDIKTLEAESGISRYTWRSWIQRRRIAHVRLGRRTLVDRADFEALIHAGRVEAR